MKKVLFILAMLMTSVFVVGATAASSDWAQEPTPLDFFEYRLNPYDHIIAISDYVGDMVDVWLDGTYDIDGVEYSVIIDDSALFAFDKTIRSAIIGEGIEEIPDATFNSCSNLERVYLPSTMEKLDSSYTLLDYMDDIREIYYGGTHTDWYLATEFVDEDVLNYIPVYCNSRIENGNIIIGELYNRDVALSVATKISGENENGEPVDVVSDPRIWASEYTPINDFRYTLDKDNKTITLIRFDGGKERVALSPIYNIDGEDYSLVSMGEEACFFCDLSVTSVYIPEGVTYIGDNCFNSCAKLRNIYIPSTVYNISTQFLDYLGNYQVFFNSTADFNEPRDTNVYSERDDSRSNAEDLGEDIGRSAFGVLDGFFGELARDDDEEEPPVNIYYGGTEDQWHSLVG